MGFEPTRMETKPTIATTVEISGEYTSSFMMIMMINPHEEMVVLQNYVRLSEGVRRPRGKTDKRDNSQVSW